MIVYIENTKQSTKKPLEQISEPGKFAGHYVRIQKSNAFLKISNEQMETLKIVIIHNCVKKHEISKNTCYLLKTTKHR